MQFRSDFLSLLVRRHTNYCSLDAVGHGNVREKYVTLLFDIFIVPTSYVDLFGKRARQVVEPNIASRARSEYILTCGS